METPPPSDNRASALLSFAEQRAARQGLYWQTARYRLALDRPLVMGIVNVTPDSFSDGGRHLLTSAALAHCATLIGDGADILDIGGESTRPGAVPPGEGEEASRVLPVLREAVRLGVPISVDTSEPALMQAALDLGVDIVNDVRSLQNPAALDAVAAHRAAGICLMHMPAEPAVMQSFAHYENVVDDVRSALRQRVEDIVRFGIAAERIVVDPGIGFGKTAEHNVTLLARQTELLPIGRPLLVGWSRKGTLGLLTGKGVRQRAAASVAAALIAVQRGASIVRVHDVADTVDALKVWRAVGA